MFNKSQRKSLGKICAELYGVETAWVRLMKDPRFRPVVQATDAPVDYLHDGKRLIKVGTAKSLGLVPRDYEAPTKPVVVSRDPTFDELRTLLGGQLIEAKLGYMDDEEQLRVLTYLFSKKLHPRTPLIRVVDPNDADFKATISSMSSLLPEEYRKFVESVTSSVSNHGFDAVQFIDRLLFAFQNEAEAEQICVGILNRINLASPRLGSRRAAELNNAN